MDAGAYLYARAHLDAAASRHLDAVGDPYAYANAGADVDAGTYLYARAGADRDACSNANAHANSVSDIHSDASPRSPCDGKLPDADAKRALVAYGLRNSRACEIQQNWQKSE